jgi:hypothetical protein
MASAATSTQAAALEDIFTVRGHATLGLVHSDEDQADFTSNPLTQLTGAGASRGVSFDVDSRFAAQLDISITPRLFGVVQLVSESNNNNSWDDDINNEYRPSLEWANLTYRVTDDFTIRGGRVVLPLLMFSEYRKVGIANHWLRAPVEVYGQLAFTSSDGVDASYRSEFGQAINTARAHYGTQSLRTLFDAEVEVWGVNDSLEIGALTLRAAHMNLDFESSNLDLGVPGLTFAGIVNPFVAIAASLPGGIGLSAAAEAARLLNTYDPTIGTQSVKFYDLGATYDPGKWFVMGEVLHQSSKGILGDITSGFVSGGYRWNQFTPYATFAVAKNEKRNEPGVPLAGLPPELQFLGGLVNSLFEGALRDRSQQTYSVGLRWDIASKFALKGQYDYIDVDGGSDGQFSNRQPGFVRGSSVNLISIAVDYVF